MPPEFSNPIFEELYKKDFFIDEDILFDIVKMGKEAVPELKKIVSEKIDTFEQYEEESWFSNFSFIHGLYLLYELDAEESLPLILKVAAQKISFLDYWFSDHIDEDLPEIIARLGRNQLEISKKFVQNPKHSIYSRSIVVKALILTGAVYPEKREEVTNFFREYLRHFVDNSTTIEKLYPEDKNEYGYSVYEYISFMLADLQSHNFTELEEEMRLCYQKGLVDESIIGGEENIEFTSEEVALTAGIAEKYEEFKKWFGEDSPFHPDAAQIAIRRQQQEEKTRKELEAWQKKQRAQYVAENIVPVRTEPKINRNDPCPCGSGKKYKKCCME